MSVNVVTISGNLTHDPEVRSTTGEKKTSVCRFRIGVNEWSGGQESTFFLTCVAFGRQAENLERYCSKGRQVTVVGRLSIREYERQDGGKAYATEVLANQIEFMRQPKGEQKSEPKEEPNPREEPKPEEQQMPMGFDALAEEDDVPF